MHKNKNSQRRRLNNNRLGSTRTNRENQSGGWNNQSKDTVEAVQQQKRKIHENDVRDNQTAHKVTL